MRKRLSADRASFIEPYLSSPADKPLSVPKISFCNNGDEVRRRYQSLSMQISVVAARERWQN
jgi:hypothetical protein